MHEKIQDALNEIRDDYIEKAAKPKKRIRWAWIPAVAAVLAVAILVGSLADTWALQAMAISQADYDQHRKLSWEEGSPLAGQLQPFFAESMGQILESAGQENKAYSPVNLYMALAVTAELSGGNGQLLQLLDADSLEGLRAQANLVWNACYYDNHNQTLLANSVWLQEDMNYNREVLDTLAETYFTSSYEADFGTSGTNRAIGSWLDQQTGNLLQDSTSNIDLSPQTVFALYSTVYYQAKWASEFSKKNNTEGIFHGVKDATCTFMNKEKMTGVYYWGEDFGAVALHLKDGSNMWLILPDEGKTVQDVLSTGAYLEALWEETENQKAMKINLSLPKFDISTGGALTEDLQAMGITEIFDRNAGAFSGFVQGDMQVWVDAVNQATRVAIDEEGVTAASYIEIPGAGSAAPPEEIIDFILDRPFLFVITNRYDLPLFAGVVNDLN